MSKSKCFLWAVALALGFSAAPTMSASSAGQVFSSPEDAVQALRQVVTETNRPGLQKLFGDAAERLMNPDEVQGSEELAEFSAALNATNRLVRQTASSMLLEIGPDAWPFPIPIVQRSDGWSFDTDAGLEELLNRRIGRNELDVLKVLRAYVQAQREYATKDRDSDMVLEYAQNLASTKGQTDGLYWPPELNGEVSPLGPLVAYAQEEGYSRRKSKSENDREPFHGYFFKLLKAQGKHAPGGDYNYVINGNMIGGFAMVAWPAAYGDSGIMTFIVNQQGRVYQKDLGEKTEKIASGMKAYDPDPTWVISSD